MGHGRAAEIAIAEHVAAARVGMRVVGAREWVKTMLATVGRQLVATGTSSRAVILCYHSVSTNSFASATPQAFEQHLQWLRRHCEVVPFRHILDGAGAGGGRRPAVAVTFDDGYADNYEHAFPLLDRYEVPATFFLTAGLLERDPRVLERFQRLQQADAGEIRPLTWPQVRQMRKAGMAFGAHTYSHPNLSRLTRAAAEAELRRAKVILETRLGEPIGAMAYPFGIPRRHVTRDTMDAAAAVGYDCAATITFRAVRRAHSPFAIPRFAVPRGDVRTLEDIVFGAWDLLGVWQERAPLVLQTSRWDRDA